jgi:hypothetical protein
VPKEMVAEKDSELKQSTHWRLLKIRTGDSSSRVNVLVIIWEDSRNACRFVENVIARSDAQASS